MTCPFLREAQVRYCRASSVRKLIPLAQAGGTEEKCSSLAHTACPVFRSESQQAPADGPCPLLRESLMQYCAAASVTRFVPYSESLLSRCGTDSFRYCDLYLSMAHPGVTAEDAEGFTLPGWLRYSANHMWLDVTEDGMCHAGIDGFLARALGKIDRLDYVWQKGRHCPTAVLTAAGQDFEVVFPNPILITACNLYLRANPARLTAEPYTGGWLFEGMPLPETQNDLRSGAPANEWMEGEQRRISEFLQQPSDGGQATMADGGHFVPGLAAHLPTARLRALFHDFFSPRASKER